MCVNSYKSIYETFVILQFKNYFIIPVTHILQTEEEENSSGCHFRTTFQLISVLFIFLKI